MTTPGLLMPNLPIRIMALVPAFTAPGNGVAFLVHPGAGEATVEPVALTSQAMVRTRAPWRRRRHAPPCLLQTK
jgi:hypothetical protein